MDRALLVVWAGGLLSRVKADRGEDYDIVMLPPCSGRVAAPRKGRPKAGSSPDSPRSPPRTPNIIPPARRADFME